MTDIQLLIGVLISLLVFNAGLAIAQLFVVIKFGRLLAVAAGGAADHFEKLRKMRQIGV